MHGDKEDGGKQKEEEVKGEGERIRDKQAEHTSAPSQHCWGGCNFTLRQVHNQSLGVHACVCALAHVWGARHIIGGGGGRPNELR